MSTDLTSGATGRRIAARLAACAHDLRPAGDVAVHAEQVATWTA